MNDSHYRRLVDALETAAIRHAAVSSPKLFEAMKVPEIQDAHERELATTVREALDFVGRPKTRRWLDAFWEAYWAASDLKDPYREALDGADRQPHSEPACSP